MLGVEDQCSSERGLLVYLVQVLSVKTLWVMENESRRVRIATKPCNRQFVPSLKRIIYYRSSETRLAAQYHWDKIGYQCYCDVDVID
ncbi:Hypothetical predicted protein [Octopus vulgaris]|uniref:Uncharacterized protein n=1 Tax=Octopus vulgaris TaxID=6645 RepID=A0AA36BFY9_OCTVU|nr:Hypothetical predicted protein [Octopus vulgaris]